MIYDIAVGAFIALAVYDLVAHLSHLLAHKVQTKQRVAKLKRLIDEWDDMEEYVFDKPQPRKKAAVKKKAVAKKNVRNR